MSSRSRISPRARTGWRSLRPGTRRTSAAWRWTWLRRSRIEAQLGVTVTEELTVSAPLRPESELPWRGTVLDDRLVSGLPLDGRNFLELALLAPGAVPSAPGSADLDPRRLRIQRERCARGQQRVPARRRLQRRSEAERCRRAGAGGCHPRVRGGHQLLRCVLRPQRRGTGQRDHAVRVEPLGRHGVPVPSERRSRRAQLLRAPRRAGAQITSGTSSAGRSEGRSQKDRTFVFSDYEGTRMRRGHDAPDHRADPGRAPG